MSLISNTFTLNVAAGSTAIELAAAGMSSGQWLNFGASSGTTGLINFAGATGGPGASGVRTPYCSKGAPDEVARKLYIHTGDHNEDAFLFSYDYASNAWSIDHSASFMDVGAGGTARHGYDHNVWDTTRRVLYTRILRDLNIRRWNGGGDNWTTIPISPLFYQTSAAGQCYHEALDRILIFQRESGTNGALVSYNPANGAWATLVSAGSGSLPNAGDPHNFGSYQRNSQVAWFGGGDTYSDGAGSISAAQTWTINASGTVQAASATPAPLGTLGPGGGPSLVFPNVSNGNFIAVRSSSVWYDFDVSTRTFAARAGTATGFVSNLLSQVDANAGGLAGVNVFPLWTLGVVAFVKAWARNTAAEMWLFKP